MDIADITDRNSEMTTQANCHQSHKPTPEGKPTGHCWFCNEPVEAKRRWCNKACCDDWQLENN